ncbi:hypothetical protein DPSP01_003390 [Paraphaeosphaeria sporulosa]|uniref:Ecp2 effector protein domain-containing protein n=1 Tax=Paraphaeosphaeria sporulosa TaxID=1460663 RepID=A0A177CCT8_9PLEO|nr:uncharacterized protein CC84DRAFT_1165463 [Paraphaeosphaeria sporulosa]OAG05136.1 hypothetical protein CC84DRAFT_1165463 [Paraphaeosphaeria sporulosa]
MRFTATFALPLLLSSVTAFVIPQGQADGAYSVQLDSRGNEIHARLSDAPEISVREASPLVARAVQSYCGCGIGLNAGDTDAANADLVSQLGRGSNIGAHLAYYSKRGGVVAFACNLSGGTKLFAGDAIGQNNAQITASCGRYIAGSRGEPGNWATGYMRTSENGGNFCGAALSSGAHNC